MPYALPLSYQGINTLEPSSIKSFNSVLDNNFIVTKGVSAIIATLLMLVITISIATVAASFIFGLIGSKTSTVFTVVDSYMANVTIRNDGSKPITQLIVNVDGTPIDYTVVPVMDGLISYWSFDEPPPIALGSKAKDSMGVVDFNIYNLVSSVPGIHGNALRIDSTVSGNCMDQNAGVYIPQALVPSSLLNLPQGDFTLSWWDKLSSDTGFSRVLVATTASVPFCGDCSIWPQRDRVRSRTVGGAAGIQTDMLFGTLRPTPILNTWRHMVYVFDRTNSMQKLYIGGSLIIQAPLDSGSYGNLKFLSVGIYKPDCVDAIPGAIYDEYKLFKRALSDEEIRQLASGPIAIQPNTQATIRPSSPLQPGTHTMKICTESSCSSVLVNG